MKPKPLSLWWMIYIALFVAGLVVICVRIPESPMVLFCALPLCVIFGVAVLFMWRSKSSTSPPDDSA